MAEPTEPEQAPKTDQLAAGGAVLMIAATVIGLVGVVLVTLGQIIAAPLVLLAVLLAVLGRWKLKHDQHTPTSASPPAR